MPSGAEPGRGRASPAPGPRLRLERPALPHPSRPEATLAESATKKRRERPRMGTLAYHGSLNFRVRKICERSFDAARQIVVSAVDLRARTTAPPAAAVVQANELDGALTHRAGLDAKIGGLGALLGGLANATAEARDESSSARANMLARSAADTSCA